MRTFLLAAAATAGLLAGSSVLGEEAASARLTVSFDPSPAVAGEPVVVKVGVVGASGEPLDAPVSIDAETGKLSAPERVRAGQYQAVLLVPRQLPGSRTILFLVRASGKRTEVTLPLRPGPAVSVHLDGPAVCSEEVQPCQVAVSAEDAYGNAAEEVPQFTAQLGHLSEPTSEGEGRWAVLYRPIRVLSDATDRVRVKLGSLSEEHSISLLAPRSRFCLLPRAGVALSAGRMGPAGGAEAFEEWILSSGWVLGAGVEGSAWSVKRSTFVTVPSQPQPSRLRVEVDRTQFALGLLVLAERPVHGSLTTFIQLGASATRVSSSAQISGQPRVSDSAYAPMASAALGLGYRFAAGMPFVDIGGAFVGDAHLATDPGAKWPYFLEAGYRFDVR